MQKESKTFLQNLLNQCGPSGFEEDAQTQWSKRTAKYADQVERDVHGNAIAVLKSKPGRKAREVRKVMLSGHCDEIGFIITHISDEGFLHIASIGGMDPGVLPGSQVKVMTRQGQIDGVIGKKPIHLMEPEDRKKTTMVKELWVDIGAKDRKNALKMVRVGNAVAFAPNYMELKNGLFSSKGCDDRVGSFVVSEVIKILSKKPKLDVEVWSVSTVQEEIGLRGARTSAYGIDPEIAIAVDVGFASDTPGIDKRVVGEVSLGKGPILHAGPNINRALGRLLETTAKKKKIECQFSSEPGATGTDANALQITRKGVATALVSIPNRYMHTMVETCSFSDLETTAKLIAETILEITPRMSFIPK
jgi:putative aminopeptidase FrvX